MDDKQFDKVIRALKKQAKARGGYVLHDEVNDLITDEFEISELDQIYDRLGELKIDFFDDEESARQKMELKEQRRLKKLKTEKKAARANVKYDDPVRMYLREMGKVPLLDRKGEVALAQRMEEGTLRVIRAILQSDHTLKEMRNLSSRLEREMIPLDEVIKTDQSTWNSKTSARKESGRIARAVDRIENWQAEIVKARKELGGKPTDARRNTLEKMISGRETKIVDEFVGLRLSSNQIESMSNALRTVHNKIENVREHISSIEAEITRPAGTNVNT